MAKKPTINVLKKYLNALTKTKFKYVTSDKLAHMVGIYPEVINDTLSYFEPMLLMDYEYNLKDLIPAIEQFIKEEEDKKTPVVRKEAVTKKTLGEFDSISDFIYQKMSIGGMLDKNRQLTDKELRILKKLINEEQLKRKNKK